jgi:DNA-binding transcriptional regulator YdaS (Cro superfamily)
MQNKGLAKIRTTKGMATKIAVGLKISRGSVSRWRRVPAERVVDVEKITGIPREELRPDLYRR